MDYYNLQIAGLKRELPIVSLGPKVKIASVNLLGDRQLVEAVSKKLADKIRDSAFDYFVGPEVKVVPLLHELSKIFNKERYVVFRKRIHGYMVSPVKSGAKPGLVADGRDADLLKGKKVVVVDDVVASGRTMEVVGDLIKKIGAYTVMHLAVFKQGKKSDAVMEDLVFLDELPIIEKT